MGKRVFGYAGVFFLVVVLMGCEEAKVYTYADFLGEWTLPDVPQLSIMQMEDDPSQKNLDIRWEEGTIEYFVMVDGTESGNVFTGEYAYSTTADNGAGTMTLYYGDNFDLDFITPLDEPKKTITITLTMYKDKPKLTCVGDTPLGGKVFSM